MPAIEENSLAQLRANILTLSQEGKYGEAVCLLSNVLLSSDDELKDAIKRALREKETEDIAVEQCCSCCSSCSNNGCVGGYCIGFVTLFFCCGEDVASTCCGCDWASDSCAACTREQCGC